MAGSRTKKQFVSRKKRREISEARERREQNLQLAANQPKEQRPATQDHGTIPLPTQLTVGQFAERINIPVVQVISALMKNGILAPVNQTIDFDTMAIIASEFGFTATTESTIETTPNETALPSMTKGELRPPVVTIMGHVDHGKTTLLDFIRDANVAGGEHGGITQHIGAYQAEVEIEGTKRLLTFLDTPGHEAFSTLRAHGANITDVAILVVAADDGVKPQTIEAISHLKSAHVPFVVAINKIDASGANIDRVKQQLTEHEVIAEDYGGNVTMVPISAKTGEGVNDLLEVVVLVSDLKAPKADAKAPAQGVVIEAGQQVGLGPVATILVQNGTLKRGEFVIIGSTYGRVRQMVNDRGQSVDTAPPGMPVKIAGLETTPEFGQPFTTVNSIKEAKALTEQSALTTKTSVQDLSRAVAEGRANTLNIIIKADAQGSVDALTYSINAIDVPGVKPRIIHRAIGNITDSDILMASAGMAMIVGFNVDAPTSVQKTAEQRGVTIATYRIIYDVINDITAALEGRVETKTVEEERGSMKVKKIFRSSKSSHIVGGAITAGIAVAPAIAELVRDGEIIGRGEIKRLQKGPEAVNELDAGQDAGIELTSSIKPQPDDIVRFIVTKEVIAHTDDETEVE